MLFADLTLTHNRFISSPLRIGERNEPYSSEFYCAMCAMENAHSPTLCRVVQRPRSIHISCQVSITFALVYREEISSSLRERLLFTTQQGFHVGLHSTPRPHPDDTPWCSIIPHFLHKLTPGVASQKSHIGLYFQAHSFYSYQAQLLCIINPRRACAPRVTVVGFVCQSVCYSSSHFSSVFSFHKGYHLLNGQ